MFLQIHRTGLAAARERRAGGFLTPGTLSVVPEVRTVRYWMWCSWGGKEDLHSAFLFRARMTLGYSACLQTHQHFQQETVYAL